MDYIGLSVISFIVERSWFQRGINNRNVVRVARISSVEVGPVHMGPESQVT